MRTFSKIAIGAAAVIGIALAAVAYAHGPGYGYGQGMGMMGPSGGEYGTGMHGMHGGGYGASMQGMYGGGYGAGMHGMHGGGPGADVRGMTPGGYGAGPCAGTENVGAPFDAIESELKLTAEQAPAWDAFKDAVSMQMQAMWAAHPHSFQNENEHIAFMEQRLEGMKAVQKARTDLYNVLTPEQKATVERYGFRGPNV
jgi:Spy/CpxP family protein refolding chaperone